MMGGIRNPDLRCEEHSSVLAMVRDLLVWFQDLDERVKALEVARQDTDVYEGE
jgi:hypothetical protein